jgi:hypothetical protein
MQIAARQRLFDYAVTEALEILGVAVEKVKIPEYKTTLEIPVIGGIDVTINNVNITDLQVCTAAAGTACTVNDTLGLCSAAVFGCAQHGVHSKCGFTCRMRMVKAARPCLGAVRVADAAMHCMSSTSSPKPTCMCHLSCVYTFLPAVPCRYLVN